MSLITRINKIFSKPDPSGILGLSLQQKTLSYCNINGETVSCGNKAVTDSQYHLAFNQIDDEDLLQGQCHIVLSSKQNQIVQTDKPSVPDEDINGAVKWQIKDLVSIPPENMIVDYFDGVKMSSGVDKINVVCAERAELALYVEQLSKYPIAMKSITVEEFAFASLCPIEDDARVMLCKQPNEDMLLLIVKQGALYFQRRLRGLDQIANKSEDELNMGVIDSLSLEIQRSTDYFERQLKQAPIRSIDVLVPMKNEAFLARRLAENTNVPVNIFTMPEGFESHREYAACIGATMLNHMGEKA